MLRRSRVPKPHIEREKLTTTGGLSGPTFSTGVGGSHCRCASPEEFSRGKSWLQHSSRRSSRRFAAGRRARSTSSGRKLQRDGTFRGDAELRACIPAPGSMPTSRPLVYCRIGERSARTWFVLRELLGLADVRYYDGSWVEYGSLVGVPVEV